MRTLFHASPVRIDKFDFSKGVHFGAFHSALEAALRKTDDPEDIIYIHKVKCKHFAYMNSFDVGCEEEWVKVLAQAKEEGFDVVGYSNRYEPGNSFSFIFTNDCYISDVEISTITAEDATEEIEMFLSECD